MTQAVIDLERMRAELNGDEELIRTLATMFVEEANAALATMEQALALDDCDQVYRLAPASKTRGRVLRARHSPRRPRWNGARATVTSRQHGALPLRSDALWIWYCRWSPNSSRRHASQRR